MPFEPEQAKRVVQDLLKHVLSTSPQLKMNETETGNLAGIVSFIEFSERTSGEEFYGLVHVFVSPRQADVASLAGRIVAMHTPPSA